MPSSAPAPLIRTSFGPPFRTREIFRGFPARSQSERTGTLRNPPLLSQSKMERISTPKRLSRRADANRARTLASQPTDFELYSPKAANPSGVAGRICCHGLDRLPAYGG